MAKRLLNQSLCHESAQEIDLSVFLSVAVGRFLRSLPEYLSPP
jgi:hypothetical protein